MGITILSSLVHTKSNPAPIPYTGDPLRLCWADILLFCSQLWSLPGIIHPFNRWDCGKLDELYPSGPNLLALALHSFLVILQTAFLVTLPVVVVLPVWTAAAYVCAVMAVNWAVCRVLNGGETVVQSRIELGEDVERHKEEKWIYLNGVSIGYASNPHQSPSHIPLNTKH